MARLEPLTGVGTTWDLEALVPGGVAAAVAMAEAAVTRAEQLDTDFRGRVRELDAHGLAAVCAEIEAILGAFIRPSAYATLRFGADSRPPEHGALLAQLQELGGQLDSLTAFFDLEWTAVGEARAEDLLADPVVDRYRHHLEELRASGPYRLSEAEERVFTEKALTGAFAWQRLFNEHLASLRPRLDGEPVELGEALAQLTSADRDMRRAADRAVTECLEPGVELRARILNIVLTERLVDDRLRGFSHWLAEFNLDNEASDASVRVLAESVVARSDIPRRWMRAKARALGLERMADFDERAPLADVPAQISWETARETVIAAYEGFSEELGAIVRSFFADGLIDAAPRPGKQGGAFCLPTVPEASPYILLNFSESVGDVLTLAHELGHGVHGVLAAERGVLSMTPPLTLAETASVFGETLTFNYLLERAEGPSVRLGMLAKQLDEIISAVFTQIQIHRFEGLIHTERRQHGELTVDRFGELWLSLRREMLGDAVEVSGTRASWWSRMTHVFRTPGYVYTYAYGQLLALSLYGLACQRGSAFSPRLLDLLRAGGSRRPTELLRELGIELEDPGFWNGGLAIVDDLVDQAEAAIEALGR